MGGTEKRLFFARRQESPLSNYNAFEFERSELDAREAFDGVSESSHHSSDLSIAAFAQFHPEVGSFPVTFKECEFDGRGTVGEAALSVGHEDSFGEFGDRLRVE